MFGFLSPRPHSLAYRSHYARLCQHQRQNYGIASLPFHSFEAVFLFQLAVDCWAVQEETIPTRRCCKMSWNENVTSSADAEIGRYCASFALILASTKLSDDVWDARSWVAGFTRWVLRSRIVRAENHLRMVDPQLLPQLNTWIAAHHALEVPGRAISLPDYVQPTAACFGAAFRTLATVMGKPDLTPAFEEIGRGVGAALLAYDAAADWAHDRANNHFNPLKDETEVKRAFAYAAEQLEWVTERCRWHFGHGSHAAATSRRVAERVMRRVVFANGSCAVVISPWKQVRALAWATARSFSTGELALAGVHAMAGKPIGEAKPWDRPEAAAEEMAAEGKAKSKSGGGGCCDNSGCNSGCECCAVCAQCCECLTCCAA